MGTEHRPPATISTNDRIHTLTTLRLHRHERHHCAKRLGYVSAKGEGSVLKPRHIVFILSFIVFSLTLSSSSVFVDGSPNSCNATAACFYGYVKQSNGSSLSGATVKVYSDSGFAPITTLTGNDGFYALNVKADTYVIAAVKEGYTYNQTRKLFLPAGKQFRQDFSLSPRSLQQVILYIVADDKFVNMWGSGWQTAGATIVAKMSSYFELYFSIKFIVNESETVWNSPKITAGVDPCVLLNDARSDLNWGEGDYHNSDILLVLTTSWKLLSGETGYGGCVDGPRAMLASWLTKTTSDFDNSEQTAILMHETGHLYGLGDGNQYIGSYDSVEGHGYDLTHVITYAPTEEQLINEYRTWYGLPPLSSISLSLHASPAQLSYGNIVTVSVMISPPWVTGFFNITISGLAYKRLYVCSSNSTGAASILWIPDGVGDYSIQAEWWKNNYDVTNSISVNIAKASGTFVIEAVTPSNVTLTPSTPVVNVTVAGQLYFPTALAEGAVTTEFYGTQVIAESYNARSFVQHDGSFVMSIPIDHVDVLKIIWAGDANHNPVSKTIDILITKADVTLEVSVPENVTLSPATPSVNATINGRFTPPAEGIVLTASVPTESYVTEGKTGLGGNFTIPILITHTGVWHVVLTWAGETNFAPISKNVTITVTKANVSLEANVPESAAINPLTQTPENVQVNGRLTPPAAGIPILVSIQKPDGTKTQDSVVTGTDGRFTATFPISQVGNWNVLVEWRGDQNYNAISKNATIVTQWDVVGSTSPYIPFTLWAGIAIATLIGVAVLNRWRHGLRETTELIVTSPKSRTGQGSSTNPSALIEEIVKDLLVLQPEKLAESLQLPKVPHKENKNEDLAAWCKKTTHSS
jgi:hypothetical protein